MSGQLLRRRPSCKSTRPSCRRCVDSCMMLAGERRVEGGACRITTSLVVGAVCVVAFLYFREKCTSYEARLVCHSHAFSCLLPSPGPFPRYPLQRRLGLKCLVVDRESAWRAASVQFPLRARACDTLIRFHAQRLVLALRHSPLWPALPRRTATFSFATWQLGVVCVLDDLPVPLPCAALSLRC